MHNKKDKIQVSKERIHKVRRKTRKKKIVSVLLAASMCGTMLAGCGRIKLYTA